MDLAIDRCSGGDYPGAGIDLEESIGIAGQAVGDGIRGRIQIERVGSDTYGRSDGNVLIDCIRCCVGIGWVETSNSSRSLIAMLNVCVATDPSLEVA